MKIANPPDHECALNPKPTQVIRAEVGVAQDAGEGAATKFPVQRTTSACRRPAFFKADATATLTDDFPVLPAKRALISARQRRPAGAGSRRQGNRAADYAAVERLAVFAQPLST